MKINYYYKYCKYKKKYLEQKYKNESDKKNKLFFTNCQQCKILWKIKGDYINSGGDGEVFNVCDQSNNCNYIDKVQDISIPFETEKQALLSLQNKSSFVPKIFQIYTLDNKGHIIMEDLLPGQFSRDNKLNILDELHTYGWYHLDAHSNNWMKRENGEIVLIDYGEAINPNDVTDETIADIIQDTFIPRKSIRYIPNLSSFIKLYSNGKLDNLKLKDNMIFFKEILSFIDKMKISRSVYRKKIISLIQSKVKAIQNS